MELWGRCASCDRWFYCPIGAGEERGWRCPVCGSEPVAIENRAPRHEAAVLVLRAAPAGEERVAAVTGESAAGI